MKTQEVLNRLPFSTPYLFVDELHYVNENGACGSYRFTEELDFFKGHFKDFPVTPGAILIESMAQIGGACLGIYLNGKKDGKDHYGEMYVASSYNVEFYKPVYPNEKVTVTSEKVYFRFGKLKYKVTMKNEKGELISKGVFSGMQKTLANE